MQKYAQTCWSVKIVDQADEAKDIDSIHVGLATVKKFTDGSITALFERKGKEKVMF